MRDRENGEILAKVYKLPGIRKICSGDLMNSMMTKLHNGVLYFWKLLKELDLKCFYLPPPKKEEMVNLRGINDPNMIITLQCVHVWSHHVVWLKLTQSYMSIISQ